MIENWDLLNLLKNRINEKGGIVSCHAHFDKSHIITTETLKMTEDHMEIKWDLWKQIKEKYTNKRFGKQNINLCRKNDKTRF
jgi:cytosine/creatinine deaminase